AGVAMIGMIVVGTGSKYYVGVPLPDSADDLLADLESGQKLAVVVVENLVGDTEPPSRFFSLETTPMRKMEAAVVVMPGVAVGDGHEFHVVSQRREFGGCPGRTNNAVVRMSAESDHSDLLGVVSLGLHDRSESDSEKKRSTHGKKLYQWVVKQRGIWNQRAEPRVLNS